jgi:hypothetical protein
MHANLAIRPLLWDKVYAGIPPPPVTAVTVPANRFKLERHALVIVEVGHSDSDDTTVLHVPDLELVVAGDVIYNGVHMYFGQAVGGFGAWRTAIDKVDALTGTRHGIDHPRSLALSDLNSSRVRSASDRPQRDRSDSFDRCASRVATMSQRARRGATAPPDDR